MIKTSINRHDMEYYLYAMLKAFYPMAEVLAPDKAEHNRPEDNVGLDEDCVNCEISEGKLSIRLSQGQVFATDSAREYSVILDEKDEGYKDEIRGYIYDFLSDYSGKKLLWGNLTGIRPTKLYLNRMLEGQMEKNGNQIYPEKIDADVKLKVKNDMQKIHRVGNEKANLAIKIASTEKVIIDSLHTKDGYSVYVGIPFCPSRCLYCSFTSNPISKYQEMVADYLEAIKLELQETALIMKDYILDTIYIGGGTPTALSAGELDILLDDIVSILPMENVMEFTVEAGRPDSITREKLEVIRKYPVTRISINPQTMKDETLKAIGRKHTVEQLYQAFALARELGFNNINMDIILGLPGENNEDIQNTLSKIGELGPESLTVHSLAIKRASRLKEVLDEMGDIRTLDFDKAMEDSIREAEKNGLTPYYLYRQKDMGGNLENTGFSVPGKYGLYNILMMEEVQSIVAVGAGTVSKRVFPDGHIERCDTVKDVGLYISKIDEMIERKRNLFAD